MDAYSGFARVYDLLMDDFDYPAWAEYYLELLARAGVRPANLCDCACGTGSMTLEFARRGLRVTGVDISREMLELAGEKARQSGVNAQFVCQDMTRLALPRPVDALVCACDGVNYLTSDRRALAFFQAAHRSIRPGGALAWWLAGIPTDVAHGVSNFLVMLLLYKPLRGVLHRAVTL